MATTRIMTLKTGRGRSVARALKDSIDYMENPFKTDRSPKLRTFRKAVEFRDLRMRRMQHLYTMLLRTLLLQHIYHPLIF